MNARLLDKVKGKLEKITSSKVTNKLGEGCYGKVFSCGDKAIKVLNIDEEDDAVDDNNNYTAYKRYIDKKLYHPNVVNLISYGNFKITHNKVKHHFGYVVMDKYKELSRHIEQFVPTNLITCISEDKIYDLFKKPNKASYIYKHLDSTIKDRIPKNRLIDLIEEQLENKYVKDYLYGLEYLINNKFSVKDNLCHNVLRDNNNNVIIIDFC